MRWGIGSRGFTLLGALATLAVLGLGAAMLAPLFFLNITVSKEEETRRRLAKLVEVIGGIPEQSTSGFIGDLGRVPRNLEELNDKVNAAANCDTGFTTPPDFHTGHPAGDHRGKVGMGWQGPYFKEIVFADEHLRDAWGVAFQYACVQTTRPATDPTTGGLALTLRTAQITSAGPDTVFGTADDIKAEAIEDRGHLFLTVAQKAPGNTGRKIRARFFFPDNGDQAQQVLRSTQPSDWTTINAAGDIGVELRFPNVPPGARFLQIESASTSAFSDSKVMVYHVALLAGIANRLTVYVPSS